MSISVTPSATPVPNSAIFAAEFLEGVSLLNGWKVTTKIPTNPNGTGGQFSVPYFVERAEGRTLHRAFLKALNLRRIASANDFARALQEHITAFNFERDTLQACSKKGMSRIAKLLDAGEYRPTQSPLPVCYIIFELAEGDARRQLANLGEFDLALTLRTLHNVTVALKQLHTNGIAHQDIKPSNVLFFQKFGAKIADLGCADLMTNPSASPRGHLPIAGDPSYAPPELLYNEFSHDWNTRRIGCDLYLLGSLIVFFMTGGVSINGILFAKLRQIHHPFHWTQDYRSVLHYVRDAFEKAMDEIRVMIPTEVRPEIEQIIRYLCEPDPKRRGHPLDLGTHAFNLERIISAFDLLATKAAYKLFRSNGSK